MAPAYTGRNSVIKRGLQYSQKNGWSERWIEEGTPAYINGRIAPYQSAGYSVALNRDGPYAGLTATKIVPTLATPYIERWEIHSEIIEKDLFSLPAAISDAGTDKKYRKHVTDIANGEFDGTGLGVNGATMKEAQYLALHPFASSLVQEIQRGVTSYETDYTVIIRERTEPDGFSAPASRPIQLASSRLIYSTSTLLSGIPGNVFFTLAGAPGSYSAATQPQTVWGWRARDQEAIIEADHKVTTRESFVFAQWSTFLYQYAG